MTESNLLSVKTIPKGFRINLTKELVSEFGLKEGDELHFYNVDGDIVIEIYHKVKT